MSKRLLDQHPAVLLEERHGQQLRLFVHLRPQVLGDLPDRLARIGLGDDPLVVGHRRGDRAAKIEPHVLAPADDGVMAETQHLGVQVGQALHRADVAAVVAEVVRPPRVRLGHVVPRGVGDQQDLLGRLVEAETAVAVPGGLQHVEGGAVDGDRVAFLDDPVHGDPVLGQRRPTVLVGDHARFQQRSVDRVIQLAERRNRLVDRERLGGRLGGQDGHLREHVPKQRHGHHVVGVGVGDDHLLDGLLPDRPVADLLAQTRPHRPGAALEDGRLVVALVQV